MARLTFGSHSEVAHAWATAYKQEDWKPFRSTHVFCDGYGGIYSWGEHWKLGQHFFTKKGAHVVFLNSTTRSPSTSKHASHVYGAAHHLDCIHVPKALMPSWNATKPAHESERFWLEEIKPIHDKVMNPRTRSLMPWLNRMIWLWNQVTAYYRAFGMKVPKELMKLLEVGLITKHPELWEKAAAYEEQTQERYAARYEEREREAAMTAEERLNAWRNGGATFGNINIYLRQRDDIDETIRTALLIGSHTKYFYALRIHTGSKERKVVQTSGGVTISYRAAKMLFCYLNQMNIDNTDIESLKAVVRRIGYEFQEISEHFITIGCHSFTRDEIKAIGQAEGWFDSCCEDEEIQTEIKEIEDGINNG